MTRYELLIALAEAPPFILGDGGLHSPEIIVEQQAHQQKFLATFGGDIFVRTRGNGEGTPVWRIAGPKALQLIEELWTVPFFKKSKGRWAIEAYAATTGLSLYKALDKLNEGY